MFYLASGQIFFIPAGKSATETTSANRLLILYPVFIAGKNRCGEYN
ncbi:hypothetical protein BN135_3710 [Cronobacter muytjensii 530]